MNNVLILGAKGNLGSQLRLLLPHATAWDRDDIDLTDTENAQEKIKSIEGLEAIINCVAYNDVDGAESNTELAITLNVKVPKVSHRTKYSPNAFQHRLRIFREKNKL